jgi:hypothetical protein
VIFEQAFYALPEVLHGSGYQQQDYEAGLVNAFSLAILQVLNGRNAPNPLGCLQNERLYRTGGIFHGLVNPRYLRADLYVNTSRLYVANRRLSQYGWRHFNWLEAKFLRKQTNGGTKHSGNKTTHVAAYIADLLRLALLVREPDAEECKSARYFLHVYDSDPKWYLTFGKRNWCKKLCQAGDQEISLNNLNEEEDSIKQILGNLPGLGVVLNITNYVALPLDEEHKPVYWCYLTRIDAVKASLDAHTVEIRKNRTMAFSDGQAAASIACFVAERLHIKEDSVEAQPPPEPDPVPDVPQPDPGPAAIPPPDIAPDPGVPPGNEANEGEEP